MTNQTKGLLLIGLLVSWGGLTLFQMSEFSETDSMGSAVSSGISGEPLPSPKDLKLDKDFSNPRQLVKFSKPRNIFAPFERKKLVKKPSPKKVSIPKANKVKPPPPQPSQPPPPSGPSPAELAAQRVRQHLNQFRFLGYLTKGGESRAFLTNGQAIYIVKQGETVEGQVQVNKIEPTTVILSAKVLETGNRIEATIPLTPENSGSQG